MRENRDIFSVYTIESIYNNIKVYAMERLLVDKKIGLVNACNMK